MTANYNIIRNEPQHDGLSAEDSNKYDLSPIGNIEGLFFYNEESNKKFSHTGWDYISHHTIDMYNGSNRYRLITYHPYGQFNDTIKLRAIDPKDTDVWRDTILRIDQLREPSRGVSFMAFDRRLAYVITDKISNKIHHVIESPPGRKILSPQPHDVSVGWDHITLRLGNSQFPPYSRLYGDYFKTNESSHHKETMVTTYELTSENVKMVGSVKKLNHIEALGSRTPAFLIPFELDYHQGTYYFGIYLEGTYSILKSRTIDSEYIGANCDEPLDAIYFVKVKNLAPTDALTRVPLLVKIISNFVMVLVTTMALI